MEECLKELIEVSRMEKHVAAETFDARTVALI